MTDLYDYHNGPNLGLEPPAAPQAEPSDDEWLRRLGELLGEYAEAVSFDSEDDIERAANAIHSHARALLSRYGQAPAADGDARDAARWRTAVKNWRVKNVEIFDGVTLTNRSGIHWDDLIRQVDAARAAGGDQ